MSRWWMRMLGFARGHGGGLALIALSTVAGVGLSLAQPWPIKWAIDGVLGGAGGARGDGGGEVAPPTWLASLPGGDEPFAQLLYLASASVLLFVAWRGAQMTTSVLKSAVGTRMSMSCGQALYEALLRKTQKFHGEHPVGDLVRRVDHDAASVQWLVLGVMLPLLTSLVTLGGILVIVWRIDPPMTLLAMGVALPLGVVIKLAAKPMAERGYEQAAQEGLLSAAAERTLSNVPLVQAFSQESRERRGFAAQADTTVRATLRALTAQLWFKGGVSLVTGSGVAVVMLIGGYRAARGHISVGELYLFIAYLATLYGPVESLAYLASGVATARARAQRVIEVMDEPEPVADPQEPVALPDPRGGAAVRFAHVRFGYEAGRPILADVDLRIEPGALVAFVGPSGVGKTTLMSLVPRFFDPWEGAVLVNGVDVRRLRLNELRRRIAWVPQEPMLLPITIAENIAFGRPDASHDQIEQAARAAGAHAFIDRLPDGYATPVGERSATLSGGQTQRIAIARALLCEPMVLMLDEPTSSLDVETEASVMAAIRAAANQRTTLVIAHRLSTVQRADRVVVMREGTIAESGTHDELIAAEGEYHRLVRLQNQLINDV